MKRLALAIGLAATTAGPLAAAADPVEAGRAIYNFRCYFCHGYSGDAKTLAATFMEPKPRDFQKTERKDLPVARIVAAVREGIPGTPMKGFRGILTEKEISEVAAFVDSEFLQKRAPNTYYHTVENGWPDHQRYAAAFPFARGEIALDTPDAKLTADQLRGKRLFLQTCITCHDRARAEAGGAVWEKQ